MRTTPAVLSIAAVVNAAEPKPFVAGLPLGVTVEGKRTPISCTMSRLSKPLGVSRRT